MNSPKQKALNAEQFGDSREEGKTNPLGKGTIMNQSTPEKSFSTFEVATAHTRVYIESDDEFCAQAGISNEMRVLDTTGMIRLDTGDDVTFLRPAEALSVAAALQAVAVHLMEAAPRELRRNTEPGNPAFEEEV
ncbi:hypothetical protein [Leucobacter tenebrionis]|uniref:hypothetical protein n=1 Tax=Leucobacter tenebrionis TaxID=2873270 RepID=UPI001CA64C07|nr:hypothetical protein [Leucobacter tenebrionis]QZY52712.1 hypothetical protein KVY00_04490 [Leucobacter tenebrionis]